MSSDKIIDRVRKLLALAADGSGATEAEAQLAAARAAEIMEEHGLETLQIERSGGTGEAREQTTTQSSFGAWYRALMGACAESCFCHLDVTESGPSKRMTFQFFGRRSAVASTQVLYEYLRTTIWRLARESGAESQRLFRHGCAERVTERVRVRHLETLREQKRAAEERSARGGSTSNALVVTLVDHEERERCLNEDFRRGVPPGTTQRKREERSARMRAQDQKYERMVAEGVDANVAWGVAYMDKTLEEAIADDERRKSAVVPELTEKQRRRQERQYQRWRERQYSRDSRQSRKRSDPSFRAGAAAGESVGLDQQVSGSGSRRIG